MAQMWELRFSELISENQLQCSKKFEKQCSNFTEKECSTTNERVCEKRMEESCSTIKEKQCVTEYKEYFKVLFFYLSSQEWPKYFLKHDFEAFHKNKCSTKMEKECSTTNEKSCENFNMVCKIYPD